VNHQGNPPDRIFLFRREYTDAFELRRAIGRSFPRSLLSVLDANEDGLRIACAVVRSGRRSSGLVIVEQEARDARTLRHLAGIRAIPELGSSPLVVLGPDGGDPHAVLRAYEDGADGFVALPPRGADLARIGSAVAELWEHLQLAKSA
jgi:hypothetical protein